MRPPGAPAKLSTQKIGPVHDASRVRGRTFLVGERGLQVVEAGTGPQVQKENFLPQKIVQKI